MKSVRAKRRRGRRPKTSENATKFGCQTVDARRNAVPIHRACIAVPLRALDIVCGQSETSMVRISEGEIKLELRERNSPGVPRQLLSHPMHKQG